MKRSFLLLFAAFVAFMSCQPAEPPKGPDDTQHYVQVESDTLYLGFKDNDESQMYIESHDAFWQYHYDESQEWCFITDLTDELGIRHLVIEVEDNDTDADRELTVTITNGEAAGSFVIKQLANSAKPATSIEFNQSKFVLSKDMATIEVEVTADGEYEIVLPENTEWISHDGTKESADKRIETFFVMGNFASDIRVATIQFKSLNAAAEVEVKQWGTTELYIDAEQKVLPFIAGRDSVCVQAAVDFAAIVTEGGDWVSIDKSVSTAEKVFFDYTENVDESQERTAVIVLMTASNNYSIELIQKPQNLTEMPEGDVWNDDIAVKMISAEGSEMSAARGPGKVIDGNDKSSWYTKYDETEPQELVLELDASNVDKIDYLRYVPATGSMTWGRWCEVEIYATDAFGNESLVHSSNLGGGASKVDVVFDPALPKTTTKLRVVIKSATPYISSSGDENIYVASAGEVGLYAYNPDKFMALDYFTDWSLSELRKDVTFDKICEIKDPFYRSLAEQIFLGTYDDEFRVCKFKAYPRPERDAKILRDKPFGLLDNVTGMFVRNAEEPQYIYLDEDYGQEIYVRVVDWTNHEDACATNPDTHTYDYRIQKGRNVIVPKYRGLMYILVFTDDYENVPEMKAHFVNSAVNGYLKRGMHTEEDVNRIFRLAPMTEEPRFDVVSDRAVLNFRKEQYYLRTFKKDIQANASRVFELMFIYDTIQTTQDYFTGLVKYRAKGLPRHHRNRMVYDDVETGALGYSAYYHIGYNNKYDQFVDPDELWDRDATEVTQSKVMNYGRVVSHELGHSTQTEMFTWRGQIEVTNNLMCCLTHNIWWGEGAGYSMVSYGDRFSGAMKDVATRWVWDFDREGNWTERPVTYVESVNCPRYGWTSDGGALETRIMPLYQLYLYNHVILGNRDFYPDYYESCRTKDFNAAKFNNHSDKYQSALLFEFVRGISEVSGLNWFDWAERWRIPGVNNMVKVSHYGSNYITTTQEDIDELEKYCSKYPKPELDPFYIHDHNIELYRNPQKVVAGTHTVNDYGQFKTNDWQNVAAWVLVDPNKKEADGTQGRVVAVLECTTPNGNGSFNYSYRESRYKPKNEAEGDYSNYSYSDDGNTNRSMISTANDYEYTKTLHLYAVDVWGNRYPSASNQ